MNLTHLKIKHSLEVNYFLIIFIISFLFFSSLDNQDICIAFIFIGILSFFGLQPSGLDRYIELSWLNSMCFIWIGMSAAIAVFEFYMKFKSSQIDTVLIDAGRNVTFAIQRVEVLLVNVVWLFTFEWSIINQKQLTIEIYVAILITILVIVQIFAIQPLMDKKARNLIDKKKIPKGGLHLRRFHLLEILKVFLFLIVLGKHYLFRTK